VALRSPPISRRLVTATYRNIFSQGQVVERTSFHYRYSGIDEKMLILPPDKQAEDEGDDEPHTA
jgi:hypothetical protein